MRAALLLLPAVLALVAVRPASAATPVYDQVSQTAIASGVRTGGVVGLTGGLATLDTGSAYVAATLDSSPSATVLAAPQEPGTLARTGVGQVNGAAGSTVLTVPDAEARYPGAQTSGSYRSAVPTTTGPATTGVTSADARVTPRSAFGTATASSFGVAPALTSGASTSTVTMAQDVPGGTASTTARTAVGDLDIGGVLEIKSIVATASVSARHDVHTAQQALTVSGATVGGQPVEIGNNGIVATGTTALPGSTASGVTDMLNQQLSAAGITVHTLGGSVVRTARSADADTGGVEIDVVTPTLPVSIAGNTLKIVIGGVSLTELDQLAVPVVTLPVGPTHGPGTAPVAPGTSKTVTTTIPGTPGIPSVAGTLTAPEVAPDLRQASYTVVGRRVTKGTAVFAFAGLQFLTLGTATLYALVERRRRLRS